MAKIFSRPSLVTYAIRGSAPRWPRSTSPPGPNVFHPARRVAVRLTTTSAESGDLPHAERVLVIYPVEPESDGTFRKHIAAHSLLTPPRLEVSGFRREPRKFRARSRHPLHLQPGRICLAMESLEVSKKQLASLTPASASASLRNRPSGGGVGGRLFSGREPFYLSLQ